MDVSGRLRKVERWQMNTWLNALTIPEQKQKKRYGVKKVTCCKAGCTNLRRVSKSGNVYTYCPVHDNERQRKDYENEKKRKKALGVADYLV